LNNNRNANNNNRRRGRGASNNRQQGGQQLNRIDSRARGNAPQMLEKYRKLAHDAHLNGDRVTEEYNLQFADHYFRVIADQRVRQDEQRQPRPNGSNDRPSEYGDDFAEDDFYGDANSPYDRAGNYAPSVQGSTQGNSGQNANYQNGQSQGGNGQNAAGPVQGGNAQNTNIQNANVQGSGEGRGGDRSENRNDRGRRNDNDRGGRNERPDRAERADRPARNDGSAGNQPQAVQGAANQVRPAEAQSGEAQPVEAQSSATSQNSSERSVYEPTENPFVRADRAPRTPRARKPRREEPVDAVVDAPVKAVAQEEPANLDLASLPPAISRRDDAVENAPAEDVPAKPKRRTRRAAPPADDAAGALESVN
jgi:hypothetical protein